MRNDEASSVLALLPGSTLVQGSQADEPEPDPDEPPDLPAPAPLQQ